MINPVENVAFTGDVASFTDLLNPTNTDASIYRAMVDLGTGSFVAAQVTADPDTPGAFRKSLTGLGLWAIANHVDIGQPQQVTFLNFF